MLAWCEDCELRASKPLPQVMRANPFFPAALLAATLPVELRGMLLLCSSTCGYTSLAVARWIHPRLHAAAAPQLRRLLKITPLSRTL